VIVMSRREHRASWHGVSWHRGWHRASWHRAAWLIRRAHLDANPLRRDSDRAEAWIRVSLVAVFLIVGPLAAFAAGRWADASGVSAARAQAAAEHKVHAVLLRSAPLTSAFPVAGNSALASVPARWTAPDGSTRTGDVTAAAGTAAGARVTVWTDASGKLVNPPLGRAQILSRVVSLVTIVPAVLGVLLLCAAWVTRRRLDARRMAAWETHWLAVEPQWTRRPH
jgi:hypothetical protein